MLVSAIVLVVYDHPRNMTTPQIRLPQKYDHPTNKTTSELGPLSGQTKIKCYLPSELRPPQI